MISVFGSQVGPEELAEIKSSIDAQWLGIGKKVLTFEKRFSAHLGVPEFALLDSGSNSLQVAIKLLNLPKDSEVILPSFTWIACAHAVLLAGCKPVFCDVDINTQNVTAEKIKLCITDKTRAIMVVHYAGLPVKMDPIIKLGFPVIEDAAHAVDSKINGQNCGTIGDVGIFSFDSVKNLAMGEGGGVTARDPSLVNEARQLRYCGIGKSGFQAAAEKNRWWEYNIKDIFPKFLPNDILASIGLVQLKRLRKLQSIRKSIWERYQKELADIDWIVRPQDPDANETHSYFTYFIRVKNGKRDFLAKYLLTKKIYTTLRFHPLHLNSIYQHKGNLPVSEQLNEEGLNLPLHPNLRQDEVSKVIQDLHSFEYVRS